MIDNKQDNVPSIEAMACSFCKEIYPASCLEPYIDEMMLRTFCPMCLHIKKDIDKRHEKIRKEKVHKNKPKVPRVQNPEKGV